MDDEVAVKRRFRVPAEKVFDAWLNKDIIDWLFEVPDRRWAKIEIDGGSYRIWDQRRPGQWLHRGFYYSIQRPTRLLFSIERPKYGTDSEDVAVDIWPDASGCELMVTQSVSAGSLEQIKQDWTMILEALAKRVEPQGG